MRKPKNQSHESFTHTKKRLNNHKNQSHELVTLFETGMNSNSTKLREHKVFPRHMCTNARASARERAIAHTRTSAQAPKRERAPERARACASVRASASVLSQLRYRMPRAACMYCWSAALRCCCAVLAVCRRNARAKSSATISCVIHCVFISVVTVQRMCRISCPILVCSCNAHAASSWSSFC